MSMILGSLLILALITFSALCLRRYANETDPALLALGSFGLANCLLVLGGALLLPYVSPSTALAAVGTLAVTGAALLARNRRWNRLERRSDTLWLSLAGLPGTVLAGFFALFIMSVSFGVEDGFFLHTSNMGMILSGWYPPVNFLGEPLQGHYGKDLHTALLALCLDVPFLEMDWFATVVLQVWHFAFLLHWLRVEGGKPAYGLLGAYFAFFGSAFGSHLGLADTIANNNAAAYAMLSLCSYLLLRWWRQGATGTAVLAGGVLGLDALVYELHFGLLGLALFSFTLLRRERYRGFLLLVIVAVGLASVEGGAITHLARKALVGRAAHQQNARKAWQSQNVELKVPKERPFTLRLDNLRPSRFFETKLRPAGATFTHSRETVAAWSPRILACFWYPVWLAPLVLLVALRQRNLLAGWFFALGTFSIGTPCLVSFGYFDGETARWLFGAAVGFSVAFAMTLAQGWQVPFPRRYLTVVLTLWIVIFQWPALRLEGSEMLQALARPGQPLPNGSPGVPPGGGLWPDPERNLAHHFGFRPESWQVMAELRARSTSRDERYLVSYQDEKPIQDVELTPGGLVNLIGLQAALSGRLPAGISGAPENRWNAPLFSQTLQARAFWADPQRWRIDQLGARWLVVDDQRSDAAPLQELVGLEKVFRSGHLSLWKVSVAEETSRDRSVTPLPLRQLTVIPGQTTAWQPRKPFQLACRASAGAAGTTEIEFRYLSAETGEPAHPGDPLLDRITLTSSPAAVTVKVVGPSFPGRYRLEWRETGSQGWAPLGELLFVERTTPARS